ncbi:unnamed protein product, partial [Lymnaea stagnalis]
MWTIRRLFKTVTKTTSSQVALVTLLGTIILVNILMAFMLHSKSSEQILKLSDLVSTHLRTAELTPNISLVNLSITRQSQISPADRSTHAKVRVNRTRVLQRRDNASRMSERVDITVEEFRAGAKTGNPLIDNYGHNNGSERGEMGRRVILTPEEEERAKDAMEKFNVNTLASDAVPLNRMVPDSRIRDCDKLRYTTDDLPTASIIIPFYDEWPSLLLRTVYSIINRTPRRLVHEILLVDDASTLDQLHEPLEDYVTHNFPQGLVRLVRNSERGGLTKARMRGSAEAKGEVLVFFDSHMEVNIEWLEPLLTEIAKNSSVVAMATLDYVQPDTLYYKYNDNYLTRYGWNWRLIFFETFFRDDQVGGDPRKPRNGASMVGAAFAIDRKYFSHLGGYDDKMTVWGGENLEMSWRVWLCGGRLLHVPCSRIGHVARGQPYSFPGGREKIEHFNLKRAASVWMQNYTRYVYNIFPDMKTLDVGDLSERLELKSRLKCKDFSWYLENVWPELGVLDEKATHWGQVMNSASELCLDNNGYLFQAREALLLQPCVDKLNSQV